MKAETHGVGRLARSMMILTILLAFVAAIVWGARAAWSLAVGGGLAIANLHLIRASVSRLIAPNRRPLVGIAAVLAKLVLMVALVAAAFSRLPIEPVSFAIGVTVLLMGVFLELILPDYSASVESSPDRPV